MLVRMSFSIMLLPQTDIAQRSATHNATKHFHFVDKRGGERVDHRREAARTQKARHTNQNAIFIDAAIPWAMPGPDQVG